MAVFENIDFDSVYSTNYLRALAKAQSTASAQKLEIQLYNPREPYSEKFKNETEGKSAFSYRTL